MIKKIFFISLFLFNFTVFGFSKSVFISVMINDKIITNLDIEKESEYLKIFNPNLNNLAELRRYCFPIQELDCNLPQNYLI